MYTREIEIIAAIRKAGIDGATVSQIATAIGRSQTIVRKWLYGYSGALLPNVVAFEGRPATTYVGSEFAALHAIDLARVNKNGDLPPLPEDVVKRLVARGHARWQREFLGGENWLEAYFPTCYGFEALEAARDPHFLGVQL